MIYELIVGIVVIYHPLTFAINKPVEFTTLAECAIARQEVLENFGGTTRYADKTLRLFAASCEPKGFRDATGLVRPEMRHVPVLE